MDVNQIFKDLAVMIHDQGEMIGELHCSWHCSFCCHIDGIYTKLILCIVLTDSIEANVENAEVHVERGTEQLQRAAYYQVSLHQSR